MKNKKLYYFLSISIILLSMVLVTCFSIVTGMFPFFNENISGDNGSGNNSGSGSNSSGDFVDISINGSALEPSLAQYEINTDYEGTLWFNTISYGNYNKKGWNNHIKPFYTSYDELNPLYFMSQSIKDTNTYERCNINIKKYDPTDLNIIPYYLMDGPNNNNDFFINYQYGKEYTLNFIPSKRVYENPLKLSDKYMDVENRYYEYCKQNYLTVPNSTNDVLSPFMIKNDIRVLDKDTIYYVFDVVKNYRSNVKEESDLKGKDLVIDLLNEYCVPTSLHYATLASLIYRNLGLPSRVAGGYIKDVKKNETTFLTNKDHICWTEVYIHTKGWIPLNVTPNLEEFYGDVTTPLIDKHKIYRIKPVDVHHKYNNTEIKAENKIQGLAPFLYKGYQYKAKIEGKRKELGISYTHIKEFILYDPVGNIVTNNFTFQFEEGILQIYREKLIITTRDKDKIYDGLPLINDSCDISDVELLKKYKHRITKFQYVRQFKDAGRKLNEVKIKILDYDDIDVTDQYYLIENFGYLTIKPRELIIETESASKNYDGTILINKNYKCYGLVDKDSINVVINGYQEGIGTSFNTILDVEIKDKEFNNNVNSNYLIKFKYGILEIK